MMFSCSDWLRLFWFLFFEIQLRNLSVLLPKEVLTFNYFDNIPECGHSNYQKCKDKIVDESFRAQPSRWGRGGGGICLSSIVP